MDHCGDSKIYTRWMRVDQLEYYGLELLKLLIGQQRELRSAEANIIMLLITSVVADVGQPNLV